MPTVQIERRKRGVFGWIVALLFWGWNLAMIAALVSGLGGVGQGMRGLKAGYEQNAYAAGAGIGVVAILIVWVLGTVILGFMMMFTRGRKETITVERS